MNEFIRTQMLLGKESIKKLKNTSVVVFGIGGVGSYVCEALARSGVGRFMLVDNDTVSESNINRQLVALHSTIGRYKTEVMKERIKDINPECTVETKNIFYSHENGECIEFVNYDYIVDCIDTVTSKLYIIEKAYKMNVPIISSMGTGNKLNASEFLISDISKTKICPLARVMRRELKNRQIPKLKVLWSTEEPIKPQVLKDENNNKLPPGSVSFVPSVAGLLIAGEVIKDIINIKKDGKNI